MIDYHMQVLFLADTGSTSPGAYGRFANTILDSEWTNISNALCLKEARPRSENDD